MRYCPAKELPSYAFRPGQHIHPNKEGGHFFGTSEVLPSKLSIKNNDFLYAIDLFNNLYYWESHVYLEAIWNFYKRKGSEADFCKALIKLAAGALKQELNQNEQAKNHFLRSKELITNIEDYSFEFLGKEEILEIIELFKNEGKADINLKV